jgi:hypothetical protein
MHIEGISRAEVSECQVRPEHYDEKPSLLEIADGIVYFSAKALSKQRLRVKQKAIDIFEKIKPLKIPFIRHPFSGAFCANIKNVECENYMRSF